MLKRTSNVICCLYLDASNNYSQQLLTKALGIVQVQANTPEVFTLGLVQTSVKPMEISPLMSVGFGSGPRLLQPLLRSYSGSSPIEVNEIIPRYNRAHCQEDFNDIQPTFSMSPYHPIIPSYVSLSSFFFFSRTQS